MTYFITNQRRKIIPIILIFVPLLIFWQNFDNQFVWDDEFILAHGEYLSEVNLKNLSHFWEKPYNELYIPVSLTAFLLVNQLSGSSHPNPTIFHLFNLLFHIFNAILVYIILRKLIKNDWAAGAGGLLFAIHPIQVEVVAFAWGFKDILSVFFALLAIWFYIIYIESSRSRIRKLFYGVASVMFILSMLSKPSTVVLPIIIFPLDFLFYHRSLKTSLKSISLWFLLTIPIVIITKLAQPYSYIDFIPPIWARPLIFSDALNFYLSKVMLPIKLCVAYGRTPQFVMRHWWIYLSWLIPVILLYLIWRFRKRFPFLAIGFLIFVVGFLPVSGWIPFEYQNWSTVADRYLYLSIIGVAMAFSALLKRWKKVWILAILLFGCWSVSSFIQASHWQNKITLWSDAIEKYPNRIPMPYNNRAIAYADLGNYEQAFDDFRQAIDIDPDYEQAYYNRGETYFQMAEYDNAFADFNQAININSDYAKAYYGRGNVYRERGQFREALQDYNRAIELNPNFADAYYSRGYVYQNVGDMENALKNYSLAIKFDSSHANAYNNRGTIYQRRRDYGKAIAVFNRAIEVDPKYLTAYNNRANTYALLGNYNRAISDYNQILKFDPKRATAYRDRAVSYFYLQRYETAWSDIMKAQALGADVNPDFLRALERELKR